MGSLAFELTGATKRYPKARAPVFSELDLELASGEFLVLLGASGCGKSTLLRCLAGLDGFSSGRLNFGASAGSAEHSVGIVFQEPRLMPWLDVAGNVELGLRFRKNRAARAEADVHGLLAELGLEGLARARPAELSGGQAQRVSLARTVITRPHVLLLDEPFGALDPATRRELQSWLLALAERRGLSLLFVTHDIDEALRLGDRVLLLSAAGNVSERWLPSEWSDESALRAEILRCYR